VRAVAAERPGALELSVDVDGEARPALAYTALVGPVHEGDRVLLNVTATTLDLGTGGLDFVVAVESREALDLDLDGSGHIMKLRYSPLQTAVLAVEDPAGAHHATMAAAESLDGTPVVWTPRHSMVAPVVAGARAAGADRVVYVMTDGAALGAPLSRICAALRSAGLLDAVISSGQAFGGDLEAVNTFSGLLAAKAVAGADVIVVGDGPGNTGTGTTWGATDIESSLALVAAHILGGRPVATLRISFADARERHRGVSHHSLTALAAVVGPGALVAVPVLADPTQRTVVAEALRAAGIGDRHLVVEAQGEPALELLARQGIAVDSMGRGVERDPAFFLAAGAAGAVAAGLAGEGAA